jgi:hypothetical protein
MPKMKGVVNREIPSAKTRGYSSFNAQTGLGTLARDQLAPAGMPRCAGNGHPSENRQQLRLVTRASGAVFLEAIAFAPVLKDGWQDGEHDDHQHDEGEILLHDFQIAKEITRRHQQSDP